MLAIKTVLAPIDFSERSEIEAETAVNIARHFGSKIVLLHVIPMFGHPHPADPTAMKAYQRKFEDEIRGGVEKALQEMAERLSITGELEIVVRSGDPATEIEKVASEQGADLVVLPTAGHGRFRHGVLGSVTTKALHDLSCPVMTGVHLERVQPAEARPYRRIGWLASLQPGDEKALAFARDFAAAYGAELRALYALPCAHSMGTASYVPDNLIPAMTQDAHDKIAKLLAETGEKAEVTIRHGGPEGALRELAKAEQVDVIVTNRKTCDLTVGVFGPYAEITPAVRLSPRPVISV